MTNIKKALNRLKWIHYMSWVIHHKECQRYTLTSSYVDVFKAFKLHKGKYKVNIPNFRVELALMNLGLALPDDSASAQGFACKSTDLCNAYLEYIFKHTKHISRHYISALHQNRQATQNKVIQILSIAVLLLAVVHLILIPTTFKAISLVSMVIMALIDGLYSSHTMHSVIKISHGVKQEKHDIKTQVNDTIDNITQGDLVQFEIMHTEAIPHIYDPYGKYLNEIQHKMFDEPKRR